MLCREALECSAVKWLLVVLPSRGSRSESVALSDTLWSRGEEGRGTRREWLNGRRFDPRAAEQERNENMGESEEKRKEK
jgi:hypothetical protein